MSNLAIPIQASIATAFINLDSSRSRKETSLYSMQVERKVGWTEIWGSSFVSDGWQHEEVKFVRRFPEVEISLFQYRPAWFEQLMLRLAGIPFVVQNSAYIATESTGPLPYLRDLRDFRAPVLVGRKDPSDEFRPFDSTILDYLFKVRGVSMDLIGRSNDEICLFQLYANLITTKLHTALVVSRFDDDDAWQQLYRRQFSLAGSSVRQQWILGSWFTAWSERTVSRYQLGPSRWTVPRALVEALECYKILEARLGTNEYILGGSSPTVGDALLFDHLANAVYDVHLVAILADFPNLIKFFDRVYNNYFATGDDEWMAWNRAQNQSNAFFQLPLGWIHSSKFNDSLEIMRELHQEFSTRRPCIASVFSKAKAKRQQAEASAANDSPKHDSEGNLQELNSNENKWRNGVIILTVGVVALTLLKSQRSL